MLYSVIPPEVVFQGEGAAGAVWEETDAGGTRRLLLRRDAGGRVVIERLISTEPRDYLDPALQPGRAYVPPPRA